MTPSDLGTPPSVEAPPPSANPGAGSGASKQPDVSEAHYRTSDEECFQCAHFQDPSTCTLGVNGGQTEPGAGCDLFEMQSGDQDGDEGGSPTQNTPPSSASMLPQGSPQQ